VDEKYLLKGYKEGKSSKLKIFKMFLSNVSGLTGRYYNI
jgi:hypothetical protein